jgi:hypothetical protein
MTDPTSFAEELTEYWHQSPESAPLRVDLRLSEAEYRRYVEVAALPDDFLQRHGVI